uniref:Putative secreted peptide n=1 Tax=Anopheles braziliensis TaxID=58242 RepID=A0A2M3ZWY1_9DIPT
MLLLLPLLLMLLEIPPIEVTLRNSAYNKGNEIGLKESEGPSSTGHRVSPLRNWKLETVGCWTTMMSRECYGI